MLFTFGLFISQSWIEAKDLPNLGPLFTFLWANRLILFLSAFSFGAFALVAFHRDRFEQLRSKVWFYKSSSRLKHSDINSSPAWYDPYFYDRPVMKDIIQLLSQGQGIVLVGVPLIGKTRCALEAVRRLRRYKVLGLNPESQNIADIQIPRTFFGFRPKLIVFLDDLERYIDKFSPDYLCQRLARQSKSVFVLATCRSGDEFTLIQKDRVFSCFAEQNLQHISIDELSKDEEKIIASHFNCEWREDSYNGTPGSIIFGLRAMRQRLATADNEPKTFMRSLYLMHRAGIQTYRRALCEEVAEHIYGLNLSRINADSAWAWLKSAGFLVIEKNVIAPTHAIYLEQSFSQDYQVGDEQEDLANLWELISDHGEAEELLDLAYQQWREKQYWKAEIGLRRLLELYPHNLTGHYLLGAVLCRQRRVEEGEEVYRKIIHSDPDFLAVHYNLGIALYQQNRFEEAVPEFHEAIRRNSNDIQAYLHLGLALSKMGRLKESEEQYREIIRRAPDHAVAHNDLGVDLHRLGQVKEAEGEYREAIRLKPDYGMPYYNLGLLLVEQGKFEEAEQMYRDAIHCNPSYADAYNNLGALFEKHGRIEEAEGSFRKAIEIKPDFALAHYNLGQVLKKQERKDEAEEEYRKAIHYDHTYAASYYGLGEILQTSERTSEAESAYQKAIDYNRNFAEAYFKLGVILGERGRLKEAEAQLRKAIECRPGFGEAYGGLGTSLHQQKQYEEAEETYRWAIYYDPNNAVHYSNLAVLLAHQDRSDEAVKMFCKALLVDPNFAHAHYFLGKLLEREGRLEEAEERLRDADRLGFSVHSQEKNNEGKEGENLVESQNG
ncbi:MAG: tetratricopeptide repeat protein [Blastocatellia bacterium]|nr:tetratricopeptide repeat protein [Blastocatellia bacterium]